MIQNKGKAIDSFPHCGWSNISIYLLLANISTSIDIRMKKYLGISQLNTRLLKWIVVGKHNVYIDGNRMKRALNLSISRNTSASSMIVHLFQQADKGQTFQFTGGLEKSSFNSLAIRFWALAFTTFSLVFSSF